MVASPGAAERRIPRRLVLLLAVSYGLHITNQSVVYRIDPAARGRITTAYMTSYFAGGALGSAASVVAYTSWQWGGVCVLGAILGSALLLLCSFDAYVNCRAGDGAPRGRPATG